ncbi:MAG: efflux RND transporter permease subunit, partial [Planctomycetales bacterium]
MGELEVLEEELQVVVDPQLLAARQLSINDVRTALRGQNKDVSGGDFWEAKRRYVVRTLGRFRSPQQVEEQILAVRDGAPVYVRDVANVRLGYKKPDGVVRRYSQSAIAVNVQRESGANVLEVMKGLRKANQRLNDGILRQKQLVLSQVYDETEYIDSAVNLVNTNIVVGGLLTVAVLLLFLRSGRSTVVIALAIPTSVIGTFFILNSLGRSLNVISLAGLAFAVGMLVDNAVVVLENVYRRYQLGEPPFTAAVRGTSEVWGAVTASTLTTLAVFLPVLFVQDQAGQLFRDIALAISGAVALSLLVAVPVIPTATARLFSERRREQTPGLISKVLAPVDWFGSKFLNAVVGFNGWLQFGMLRRVVVATSLLGLSLGASWFLWPKVEYLPAGNRNLVFGILMPPPGYNLNQLMEMGESVEEGLRSHWDVPPGSNASELGRPVIADFFFVARGRQVFLGVRSDDPTRAAELIPVVQSVARSLPGTFAVVKQSSLFERGLTSGRTIEVEITGPELKRLVELGGGVRDPDSILGQGGILGMIKREMPDAQVRPVPSLDLSSPEVH